MAIVEGFGIGLNYISVRGVRQLSALFHPLISYQDCRAKQRYGFGGDDGGG
jgi:hypothetical protein